MSERRTMVGVRGESVVSGQGCGGSGGRKRRCTGRGPRGGRGPSCWSKDWRGEVEAYEAMLGTKELGRKRKKAHLARLVPRSVRQLARRRLNDGLAGTVNLVPFSGRNRKQPFVDGKAFEARLHQLLAARSDIEKNEFLALVDWKGEEGTEIGVVGVGEEEDVGDEGERQVEGEKFCSRKKGKKN